jgi:PEP-CTERM motif
MKQRNASSFATLQISTVLAMLWALPVSPVSAIPIQLTSGVIFQNLFGCCPFEDANTGVSLEGAGFSLILTGYTPFKYLEGPPGTTVDLSFQMLFQVGPGGLTYGGQQYTADGQILVSTPSFVIGPPATVPFSLRGFLLARTLEGGIAEFELVGAGTATASFVFPVNLSPPVWVLRDVEYRIEPPPIPEPTSWMLLGSGLLGYAARRRSARRDG